MRNQESSFVQLYRQFLINPKSISVSDMEGLLQRYPYSQPLYFATERRNFLMGEESGQPGSRAILLASHTSWLAEYVQRPLEEVPLVEVEDDDYVPFEDIAAPQEPVETEIELVSVPDEEFTVEADEVLVAEEKELADVEGQQELEEDLAEEAVEPEPVQTDKDVLDTLVNEGIGGGDYFAVHATEIIFEEPTVSEPATKPVAEPAPELNKATEESIGLYNDELMPYSFRWWLHKTRLEYAETYQPFASPQLPARNQVSFDPEELDRVVLDQQIREHIIHLQNPEDKLSEEVKQQLAEKPTTKPVDEVIERFIREEPQIQPPQAENLNVENKARKSSEEQFDLVTETLAGIYADQAMYVKAIEVYKKLILRFPEKKSYFATQIKELEEKLY